MKRKQQSLKVMAIIEIGTSAIRMVVAEGATGRRLRLVDSLQQGVSIGRETFSGADISRDTIEACIDGLQAFLHVLLEYGVDPGPHVSVVATSAVREAPNREQFCSRVYIATGLEVRVLEQADVNRLVYLAVRPGLEGESFFRAKDTVVFEVGGGSTDVLVFRAGKVRSSHLYRLGAQRVQRMLKRHGDPDQAASLLREYVQMPVEQISEVIGSSQKIHLVALGSEMRFVARLLGVPSSGGGMHVIKVAELASFTEKVIHLSPRAASARFGLSAQEVELLGPMLLINLEIATRLKAREMLVSQASLRDGLLVEMTGRATWTREFRRQIMNSATQIARHYDIDLRHARRVSRIAQAIFASLRAPYQLSERDAVVLDVASLLYESGLYITPRSHHKHSMYLIQHSDIFGLSQQNLKHVALVARYHRGSLPKPGHEIYRGLAQQERIEVQKLAAILRLAHALARHQTGSLKRVEVALQRGYLEIGLSPLTEITGEQFHSSGRADLFEMVYGRAVRLTQT